MVKIKKEFIPRFPIVMWIYFYGDSYFRSADELEDSIEGKPNPGKHFFGEKQLDWLEDALVQSQRNI